jgi:hypothetical protein
VTPVVPALADHLWQSLLTCAVLWFFAWLARPNSALLRLTLWRICAVKLVLPYSLLYALGAGLGFPVAHSADTVPASLANGLAAMLPAFSPTRATGMGGAVALAFLALLLFAASAWARVIHDELGLEKLRVRADAARAARDPDDLPPGLGFWKAALFTASASGVVSAILLAGAVDNRQWRRDLLIANSLSLRGAPVVMHPAAPGMGSRSRVVADDNSVLIRNTNIQDLVALAYGVNHYAVWSDQMYSYESDPTDQYWLSVPRYDVRVQAPIREPGEFDPYALRSPITKLLAERFGLQIFVNQKCQPPCGSYGVAQSGAPL